MTKYSAVDSSSALQTSVAPLFLITALGMHKMESSDLEEDNNLNCVLDVANGIIHMHVLHS